MTYEVILKGKSTGIVTGEKKVSLSLLRMVDPKAQPFDAIDFIEIKKKKSQFRKVKTIDDIKADSRISEFHYQYDDKNVHMVVCKDGYKFEGERTIEIGNMKEICDSINSKLERYEERN